MMVFVDKIRQEIQEENATFWVEDYESTFELLTRLVADDWTLQHITVVDGDDCMVLPVEAFDGQPIHVQIRALQQEWTQLLAKELSSDIQLSNKQQFENWFAQLDTYYNGLLTHLEKLILLLEMSKLTMLTKQNVELNFRLGSQYDLLLESNKRMYWQTKVDRQLNQQRYKRLEMRK